MSSCQSCFAIAKLVHQHATENDIIAATGISPGLIPKYTLLLNLTPKLQEAFINGQIKFSVAQLAAKLQLRMESLLGKKADELTVEEIAELDAIGELDRIFTHMNAMIAAQNAN